MGIYDREYYRREGPSFLDTIASGGKVCRWLIAINIICFVLQFVTRQDRTVPGPDDTEIRVGSTNGWFTDLFLLDVPKVLHGQVWRLLTSAFLHDPNAPYFSHILFNMLFLWWFGRDIEDLYGPKEFLAFYLTAAVAGSVAFVIAHQAGMPGSRALGASGAVTAVMVLCALHYPTRMILLFFILPVPIWLLVVFQVAQDALGLVGGLQFGHSTGVGVAAHLGGAGFAFAYYKLQWRVLNFLPSLRAWQRQRTRPRLRPYREPAPEEPRVRQREPVPVTASPSGSSRTSGNPDVDEQLEAKLDAILEKVARSGQQSLTETERQLLVRASEIYKRRRQ
jgi:membrane associated rhomboid family serine protease